MKSAYELAMERLEKQAPTTKLTAEQKAQIAEVESTCTARIAEKEVFLGEQIVKATAEGKPDEVQLIEQQLAREIRRLREECEEKKERIRQNK